MADKTVQKTKNILKTKTFRTLTAIVLTIALLAVYAAFAEGDGKHDSISLGAGEYLYKSNRYTQPENALASLKNRFDLNGFERLGKSGDIELYADSKNLVFRIKDLKSGYIWSSAPSKNDYNSNEYNSEWLSRLNSPFVLNYVEQDAVLQKETSFTSGMGRVTSVERIDNGAKYSIYLDAVKIGLEFEIRLEDGELVVRMPESGFKEDGTAKILSIQVLPYFGAAPGAKIPGYIFVPDGCGALMRFSDDHPFYDEAYTGSIYDLDYSVKLWDADEDYSNHVLMPVFGMVHGAGHNAWMCVVEDGKFDAEIVAVPSGVNTVFNAAGTRFIFRSMYFQPTSKTMGGINTYQKERIKGDRQVRYVFLNGENANYSGMAKAYRKYLLDRDMLPAISDEDKEIPLHLALVGAEQEPGLLWPNTIVMTDFDNGRKIVGSLKDSGIENMVVEYLGWNRGGVSRADRYKTDVEKRLGGAKGLKEFNEYIKSLGLKLFLDRDYTSYASSARGFQPRTDAIRLINNDVFKIKQQSKHGNQREFYFINSSRAAEMALQDNKRLNKVLGSFGSSMYGDLLLSDFNERNTMTREESSKARLKLVEGLMDENGLLLKEPHEYYWKYATDIVGLPMYNAQLVYFTDTVPFAQMVLHGHIDYYSDTINLSANSKELVLRSLEYGAYPSFLITDQPSWKLQYTFSSYMSSSEFNVWKDEITRIYKQASNILGKVRGAEIVDREVLSSGVVKVDYSNNASVIVNYTKIPFKSNGATIPPEDCIVVEGGGQ